MARKSRRQAQNIGAAVAENNNLTITKERIKTAAYARLSVEKETDESIETQIIAGHSEYDLIDTYADNGHTGTDFDRPAFKRMIEDAKVGKIDTIIVKDLSRLGRDYIGVGDYLEQIFPVLGVRFIAVNSHYDSNNYIGQTMGLEMSIGNLINNLYSKDTSKKYKSAIQTKWKQGISTAGRVPFGYLKDETDPHRWILDPVASKYVRLVFDLALKNYTTKMIVDYLNEHEIPTPGKYRVARTGEGAWNRIVSDEEWLWDISKVWRILKTYSYTGALVHGMTTNIRVGGKERRNVPVKDQFIVEGNHEGIVTIQEYEDAQEALRRVKFSGIRQDRGEVLTGRVRCGNCRLTLSYQNFSNVVLVCNHRVSSGEKSTCTNARYDAKRIEGQVWYSLKKQFEHINKLAKTAEKIRDANRADLIAEQKNLKRSLEDKKAERIRAYENYANGHLEKSEYLKCKEKLTEEISRMTDRLAFLQGESETEDGIFHDISELRQKETETKVPEKLTREAVRAFIDVIYVYDAEHIEVKFLFEDLIERTDSYIKQNTEAIPAVV